MSEKPVQREGESLGEFYSRKNKWEVDTGQWCYQCGALAALMGDWNPGYKRLCHSCRSLATEKCEVRHNSYVRCPKCGFKWSPCDDGDYDLLSEDTRETTCGECDHEFEVATSITYTFTSPAMLVEDAGVDEETERVIDDVEEDDD
jgi:hypothetical protein